jgi:hypothetical protein
MIRIVPGMYEGEHMGLLYKVEKRRETTPWSVQIGWCWSALDYWGPLYETKALAEAAAKRHIERAVAADAK